MGLGPRKLLPVEWICVTSLYTFQYTASITRYGKKDIFNYIYYIMLLKFLFTKNGKIGFLMNMDQFKENCKFMVQSMFSHFLCLWSTFLNQKLGMCRNYLFSLLSLYWNVKRSLRNHFAVCVSPPVMSESQNNGAWRMASAKLMWSTCLWVFVPCLC
jgi:hypothetical protein